jgi:hypothetical protein
MEGSFDTDVMLEEEEDVINYIYTYKVSEGPDTKRAWTFTTVRKPPQIENSLT